MSSESKLSFFNLFAGLGAYSTHPDFEIYSYPHYRFFEQIISHASIITAAIYMTTIGGYRSYWRSMLRVFGVLNVYLVFVGIVNMLIGNMWKL